MWHLNNIITMKFLQTDYKAKKRAARILNNYSSPVYRFLKITREVDVFESVSKRQVSMACRRHKLVGKIFQASIFLQKMVDTRIMDAVIGLGITRLLLHKQEAGAYVVNAVLGSSGLRLL
jgi:hypothetical protein